MAELKRKQNQNHSGGVQTRTLEDLSLDSQVIHGLNCEFVSKLGAITGRKGSAKQSEVVANVKILNLIKWIKSDGTKKYFAVSDDGTTPTNADIYISAVSSFVGAWSKSLEDWDSGIDAWGANFGDKLMLFNGADTPKAWNGTGWATITNAPTAGKFPEVFVQRLFVLTESGFLYYSDVINSTGDDFTTTEWLSRGINPNDGQKSKMLKRHRGRLVIFKEESIYRYDGSNEPEAVITVGTHSGKSVVILNDLFFHHPTGIYKMGLGEPILISRAVQKYLDGMSSANWANVASGRDSENVYFWIGDVTINDPHEHDYNTTYTDVVLVYNVYAQTWTVFTGWNARVWFFDEENGNTLFGTSTGKIVKINTAYADVDGETTLPIRFEVIFNPEDYGYPEKYKEFNKVYVLGEYNSNVLAGADYKEMVDSDQLSQGEGIVNRKITTKELWFGLAEEYNEIPPRIEGFIMENTNLLEDAQ